MKRGMILFSIAAMLAVLARCQTAMIALDDIPGTTPVCVTNYGPQVVSLTARVTGLEGSSNDWSKTVSNLAALSNNVSALSSRVTATNALFSEWFAGLQSRTSYWDTAYSWGDWHSAVAQKLDITSTNGWETGSHAAFLTGEADLAALRLYHYGSPHIIESPAEWFQFDGAGTITGINAESVTNWNIVIPWEIGGVPVTEIGEGAFSPTLVGYPITSFTAPKTVTSIKSSAFYYCTTMTSVSLPAVQAVGEGAFRYCESITSGSLPAVLSMGTVCFANCPRLTALYYTGDAPTEGSGVFVESSAVTNYVINSAAKGWSATFGGMPVVRLPLHADAITLGGVTQTNWPSADVSGLATTQSVAAVAQAIAAIEFPVASTNYTAWTGTITPANGTATVSIAHGNMPVLVTDAPCVLTLDPTGYGTAGVSRVSLSYYTGTNSLTFATSVITYAETPTVDTNGWNTLLIRRVSDGAWKGVGL